MGNAQDYEAKLEIHKSIAADALKSPAIPVDNFIGESELLYHWCMDDKEKFFAVNFDWARYVEDLPVRAGALREAESRWITKRFTREEAQRRWRERSPEGYELRDTLLDTFRYAYRKFPDLIGRIAAIAEGSGHTDMVQDLNNLAVFGKENVELLNAVNFDMTLLDKAANLADELGSLYGEASADSAEFDEYKDIRDRAYTHTSRKRLMRFVSAENSYAETMKNDSEAMQAGTGAGTAPRLQIIS